MVLQPGCLNGENITGNLDLNTYRERNCGKIFGKYVHRPNVSVFPVDAHVPEITEERKYNREPGHLAEINGASIVPDSELEGLALWAYQKARHLHLHSCLLCQR